MKETYLDFKYIDALFSLCEETGVLTRKVSTSPRAMKGDIVGSIRKGGYLGVWIQGRSYRVHHIVWLLTRGEWPTKEIDHINRIRTDNRPQNLREVSHAENGWNGEQQKNNTSGATGVSWFSSRAKWTAYINVHGVRIRLGHFMSFNEAVAARRQAEIRYYGAEVA